ncbi:MAG: glycosyltransferase family 4 protein [archaeon]
MKNEGHQVKMIALYRGKSEFYGDIDYELIGYSNIFKFISTRLSKFKRIGIKSKFELDYGVPNIKKLKHIIKQFNPNITIIKSYQNVLALSVLFILKSANKKAILFLQTGKNHIKGSKILLKLYMRFLRSMNVVYFITPITKTQRILQGLGIDNCSYIPFAVDVTDFTKNHFCGRKINIICVGKFVSRKNQIMLLKSIKAIRRIHDVKLNLIGEVADKTYLRDVLAYISENNLSSIVKVKHHISYEKMINEYRSNDLFILPSYKEPASYSIVEAMANKLPVICSSDCGTQCYVQEGKTGFIFASQNETDLTDKILLALQSRKRLIEMGVRGFEFAQKYHSLRHFYHQFRDVTENV